MFGNRLRRRNQGRRADSVRFGQRWNNTPIERAMCSGLPLCRGGLDYRMRTRNNLIGTCWQRCIYVGWVKSAGLRKPKTPNFSIGA